ncbi:MAG TPA: hypothetical protein VFV99_33720 [Kofleriaceae bacterium]|nr:hypothetical protein [Kofleriaceae bacterium]
MLALPRSSHWLPLKICFGHALFEAKQPRRDLVDAVAQRLRRNGIALVQLPLEMETNDFSCK